MNLTEQNYADLAAIYAGEAKAAVDTAKMDAYFADHEAHHERDENWSCLDGVTALLASFVAREFADLIERAAYKRVVNAYQESKSLEDEGMHVMAIPVTFDPSTLDADDLRAKLFEVVGDALTLRRMSQNENGGDK